MVAALLLAVFLNADYEALVERYQANDPRAVVELGAWPLDKARTGAQLLGARSERGLVTPTFVAAAALLHTEAAFRAMNDGARRSPHVGLARALVEELRGRGGAPATEGVPSFECGWRLAVTYEMADISDVPEALRLSRDAEGVCAGQAEYWLARGTLHETIWSLDVPLPDPEELDTPTERMVTAPRGARQIEEARFCFQRAIQMDADMSEARLRLGRILCAAGRTDEGVRELTVVLENDNETARLYLANMLLGYAREGQSQLAEAATCYRRAAGLVPRAQSAVLALSCLETLRGRVAPARRLLQSSLAHGPDETFLDPWLLYNTGAPYRGLERMLNALRATVGLPPLR